MITVKDNDNPLISHEVSKERINPQLQNTEDAIGAMEKPANNLIDAYRQDQKNFRDTYARAKRHLRNGSRASINQGVSLRNVVDGFQSLTREDSAQLVKAVSKDRESYLTNNKNQIDEQRKKINLKY